MKRCLVRLAPAALVAALVPVLSSLALAASPASGTYNSADLGGAVLTGRGSQSWSAPANAAQGAGDVIHSESWDGSTLGTQWRFACGVQSGPQGVQDNRVAGTGTVVFTNTFAGGTFFLSKTGPWGDAVNDLTGTTGATHAIVTVQYVNIGGNSTPVASRLNIDSNGQFDGSTCTLTFVIANGLGQGDTDSNPPKPATYPGFLDTACGATRIYGSWGDISQLTLRVDCPVPARNTTWGSLKSIYR